MFNTIAHSPDPVRLLKMLQSFLKHALMVINMSDNVSRLPRILLRDEKQIKYGKPRQCKDSVNREEGETLSEQYY